MESFPLFFRIRVVAFALVMLFSFLWLVLLSVEMFARWTVSDHISRSLMILFLLTNAVTLILLPILILVKFRIWLDAARLLLLLVSQVGSAIAGTYWSPRIQCPNQTPDDIGVCQLIDVYTMIAFWIIPIILLLYSTYFAVIVYLQSRIPVVVELERRSGTDPEMGSTSSPFSWRGTMKEVVRARGSSSDTSIQPRPLVLPTTVHTRQSLSPWSLESRPQLTPPSAPRRQSTMPSLAHSDQQHPSAPHAYVAPSRHCSLPAFKHSNEPHIRHALTLPIPHHISINVPSPLPQTPSSYSHSTPSANSQNQTFSIGPGHPGDNRGCSKHLSIIPLCSSPREIQSASAQNSSTTHSKRLTRVLSKPLPPHFM